MICLDDAQWATAGETVKGANQVWMMLMTQKNGHIDHDYIRCRFFFGFNLRHFCAVSFQMMSKKLFLPHFMWMQPHLQQDAAGKSFLSGNSQLDVRPDKF